MKINLLMGDNSPRAGYVNIDPFAPVGDLNRTYGDVADLSSIVSDAEATEIVAADVLDYFPAFDAADLVGGWVKKLRHGGTVVVGGIDLREVARSYVNQRTTVEEVNALVHGIGTPRRKSNLTMQKVVQLLQSHSLKIIQAKLDNFKYVVKAEHP